MAVVSTGTPALPPTVTPPPVADPGWLRRDHHGRVAESAAAWVAHGSSRPAAARLVQLARLAAFAGGGLLAVSLGDGIGSLARLSSWWDEPIVLQKLAVWTLLWQLLGLGRGLAPYGVGALPGVAGLSYWLTPGTMRLPTFPGRVPFTAGTRRTVADVGLYAAVLAVAAGLLGLTSTDAGTLPATGVAVLLAALGLLALRDRTPVLAARPELHLPLLVAFLVGAGHPATAVVAIKIALAATFWIMAAVRAARGFPFAIAAALADAPWLPDRLRPLIWQRDDHDVLPGELARWLAGGLVTVGFVLPMVLFAGAGGAVSAVAVTLAVALLVAGAATFARSGQLEASAFLALATVVAFGHWAAAGFDTVGSAAPLAALGVAAIVAAVAAATAPERTAWFSAARHHAGNGPVSVWLFRADVADRFDVPGYDVDAASTELLHYRDLAHRSLHPNGRALDGLLCRAVDRLAAYRVRSGEFVAGASVGWCPEGGYAADLALLAAVQERCRFGPGELRVVTLAPQASHHADQRYRILDAASGLLEEGLVELDDMVDRVPWRDPAAPAIPVEVEFNVAGKTGYHAPAEFDYLSSCDTAPLVMPRAVRRPRSTPEPLLPSLAPALATATVAAAPRPAARPVPHRAPRPSRPRAAVVAPPLTRHPRPAPPVGAAPPVAAAPHPVPHPAPRPAPPAPKRAPRPRRTPRPSGH